MTYLGSRLRPGAAAIAAAIAFTAAPLLAQSAEADPAAPVDAVSAPAADEAPIAPFAVVHPTYVPSQPAPEDAAAVEPGSRQRPVRRAAARAEPPAVRPAEPAPADLPAIETPAAVETPPVTMARAPAPSANDQTPLRDETPRRLAAAGAAALLLAAAGFLLGRRSRRSHGFAGAVAKTASWQSVMPPGLAASELAGTLAERSPGKRVRRGRSLDQMDEPAEQPHAAPAARRREERVVQL